MEKETLRLQERSRQQLENEQRKIQQEQKSRQQVYEFRKLDATSPDAPSSPTPVAVPAPVPVVPAIVEEAPEVRLDIGSRQRAEVKSDPVSFSKTTSPSVGYPQATQQKPADFVVVHESMPSNINVNFVFESTFY